PNGGEIVSLQLNDGKSAFNRFFGFGNRASDQRETTYSMGDANAKIDAGLNLPHSLALLIDERFRQTSIENGASHTLPQTLAAFPNLPGLEGAAIWGQGLTLRHDSRDNALTPLRGDLSTLSAEYDQDFQTASRPRWLRLTGETRWFFPHWNDRAVLVLHGLLDAAVGPIRGQVPFYERPSLGGETTLRAFGRGRFTSNTAVLANIEERLCMKRFIIMGNPIELELAPFLDVGRVARSPNADAWVKRLQFNPGLGIRLLARPNVASRLDMAYGRDGLGIFVGLDYPF
ncbi:MAG: BamA/TamA family outer membrane protein, partial [Elusimicrobia bacterium]|nr:BamA/TamA family outer membrane protein [Elusimicrobiota bacterium]